MSMKKLLILLVSLVLVFGFSACGGSDSQTADSVGQNDSATNEDESTVDKSLTGKALLESLQAPEPGDFMTVTETSGMGIKNTLTMYYSGENFRTESEVEGMKQIVIYNAEEGKTYQYTEGQLQGVVLSDDMSDDMGMEEEDLDVEGILDNPTDDVIAKVETLDGHEVIHIETTEEDEDMGMAKVSIWYSEEYGIPLKYEVTSNGQVIMSSYVTKIEALSALDGDLFTPPADVQFMEFGNFGDMNIPAEYQQ